jgi:hypothetical protein
MARPSDYTPEMADEICARIAEGRSLLSISKDEDMPAQGTIYRWLFNNTEFQEKYARAREAQADVLAEEIRDIADTPILGEKVTTKADGVRETVTGDTVDRSRLMVESRKWLAMKLKPKKYGDRIDGKFEHTGKDGGAIVQEHRGLPALMGEINSRIASRGTANALPVSGTDGPVLPADKGTEKA